MNDILTTIPDSWTCYLFATFIGSMIVRLISMFFRVLQLGDGLKERMNNYCKLFSGTNTQIEGINLLEEEKQVTGDYWLGFIIGWMELIAYPILFKTNNPTFVGAWLVFKTANRWGYAPGVNRGTFNRYLFANAIVLFISVYLANKYF